MEELNNKGQQVHNLPRGIYIYMGCEEGWTNTRKNGGIKTESAWPKEKQNGRESTCFEETVDVHG